MGVVIDIVSAPPGFSRLPVEMVCIRDDLLVLLAEETQDGHDCSAMGCHARTDLHVIAWAQVIKAG